MASNRHRLGKLTGFLAVVALAGCATLAVPRVELQNTPVVNLPTPVQQAATNGAIYQSASYRPLFEDNRARLVGDTLTVNISEKISATQSSTSASDKSGAINGSISALPGVAPNSFGRAAVTGTSSNKSTGKGSNENSNEFSGTITAVVTAVLPNGHLLITGEKQIGVNQNVDVLRFSGQVDPRNILQGNSVASTAVANVRIEQRGRGSAADTHQIGWLQRFFLSFSPL